MSSPTMTIAMAAKESAKRTAMDPSSTPTIYLNPQVLIASQSGELAPTITMDAATV